MGEKCHTVQEVISVDALLLLNEFLHPGEPEKVAMNIFFLRFERVCMHAHTAHTQTHMCKCMRRVERGRARGRERESQAETGAHLTTLRS